MAIQTRCGKEFKAALAALETAGFTHARAMDLLTKRWDIRDKYMVAAVAGLTAAAKTAEDFQHVPILARQIADGCLSERIR